MSDDTKVRPVGRRPGGDALRLAVATPSTLGVPPPPFKLKVRKAHVGQMLADAYTVVSAELETLRRQVEQHVPLDMQQMKKFQILSAELVRLAREEQEQQRADKVDDLSDEELLAQLTAARKVLEGGGDE